MYHCFCFFCRPQLLKNALQRAVERGQLEQITGKGASGTFQVRDLIVEKWFSKVLVSEPSYTLKIHWGPQCICLCGLYLWIITVLAIKTEENFEYFKIRFRNGKLLHVNENNIFYEKLFPKIKKISVRRRLLLTTFLQKSLLSILIKDSWNLGFFLFVCLFVFLSFCLF